MTLRQRAKRGNVPTDPEWVAQAYRAVFATVEGQMVLDHICQVLCGVDNPLFHPDPQAQSFNLARRDVGLQIWKLATGENNLSKPEVKVEPERISGRQRELWADDTWTLAMKPKGAT